MFFTLIIFALILGLLVFVHELGHFFTARKLGVKSEEFGFGFPPRIFGWKKINGRRKFFWGNQDEKSDDTIYSLNWIPIGGFVKIKGEDGESKDSDSFASKKAWKRAAILSAGVSMNVVLCFVALTLALMIGAPSIIDDSNQSAIITDPKIQVMQVLDNSPAKEVGLVIGDEIVNIDGQTFTSVEAVQEYTKAKGGQTITVNALRYTEEKKFELQPKILTTGENPVMGLALAKTGIVAYPWYQAIWFGLRGTAILFVRIIEAFANIIKDAVTGQPVAVEVAGPVGIAVMTGQMAKMGFVYILQFTALLSMNLAIINFLPFPALDGGRVLFILIEKIRGRAVNQKVEQIAHTIGFALLMLLVIVVTGKDIWKFKDFFTGLWTRLVT